LFLAVNRGEWIIEHLEVNQRLILYFLVNRRSVLSAVFVDAAIQIRCNSDVQHAAATQEDAEIKLPHCNGLYSNSTATPITVSVRASFACAPQAARDPSTSVRMTKRTRFSSMLRKIYNWCTEGFDTADLKEAKALLDDLSGRR
jgi:hypothetical protein